MQMRDPHQGLRSHRRTQFYIREAAGNDADLVDRLNRLQRDQLQWGNFYGHMFTEDAEQILPWGDHPDSGFSVSIEPYNSDVEELITDGLISPTGPSSRLETAVRYHLSWIADMMLRGQAVYEIDLLSDADRKKVAFRTGWIPQGTIDKRNRRYIQYVPEELGEGRKHKGCYYVELDEDMLIWTQLPRSMRSTLRRAASTLAEASVQQSTPSAMLHARVQEFNLKQFKDKQAREVLSATRDLGWHARWLFDEQMTSPYIVWRHLEFQRFKLSIRDAGIASLNRALALAGGEIGFKARLVLHGAITAHDVDRAQNELRAGSRPLTELLSMHA
ncbi:hypothetical protein MPRI_25760 [Mycobacterium paraintracellulare]|uniref:Uncharacterized protein n=2 Tax=Mycobacterium paraintracellulare TaxID=1138383 RepID=A0ABN6ARR3_9MYCO|nr:hypothetical protein OCQ_07020 [Mycobacterium paraintracellulare]OSC29533.1 hypothetical protein B8W68_04640 [Mycobacterium paraintracellulare]BBY70389.1 hypothetical protein MPRI_25760 [Mycobacterium paraintracellulare]